MHPRYIERVLATPHLLAFALTAFALIVVPGPSVLFTVSRALSLGRMAGVVTVAGNSAGVYVQVAAVAFGVGYLVQRSETAFTVIKMVGAVYLCYLGIQAIRHRRSLAGALDAEVEKKSLARIVADGFTIGLANPKAIVFFTAVLPQFVDRQAGDVPGQMLMLGGVFIGIAMLSDSMWALAAGTARGWFTRSPRRLELVGGTAGLVMIGLGASLALTGRKD